MFDNKSRFHKKGTLSYMMEIKSRFALERGVILDLKINDFGIKRGVFLAQNPRKEGITWVRVWFTSGGCVCVCVGGGGGGGGGGRGGRNPCR